MYTVDRTEENIVVCEAENGDKLYIDLSEFSYTPSDGDVIYKTDGGYAKDEKETEERSKRIKERFSALFGGKRK